jgi:Cupin-like domain
MAGLLERLDAADTPLVLEGAARTWAAVQHWSLGRLKELIGGVTTQFKCSSCHQHPDFHRSELGEMFARQQSTFAEFFALLEHGPEADRAKQLFTGDEQFLMRRREGVTQIDPKLAPLLRDFELGTLVPDERMFSAWVWFSGKGVRTWLHYDNNGCHNFNVQLQGEKSCILFSPEDLRRMAPFMLGGSNPAHNCSSLDVERDAEHGGVDPSGLTRWEATVRSGDLLFIPAWWWHSFAHLGELNANVNVWWKPSRPRANATATRQAWLEAVSRTGVKAQTASAEARLLRDIDAQLIRG